jgi:hypothetical protein
MPSPTKRPPILSILLFILALVVMRQVGYGQSLTTEESFQKTIWLEQSLSQFRQGNIRDGLVQLKRVIVLDPSDHATVQLYRLNCSRLALRIAEECVLDPGSQNHCDSALRYAQEAKRFGDSTVLHEVRATALYQKLLESEEASMSEYREQMPARILKPTYCYRYLPEERKIFLRALIDETMEELQLARGVEERQEKLTELSDKARAIDRSIRLVGSR